MTEEERAALYRLQQRNQVRFRRMRNAQLAGNTVMAKAVREAWKAITSKTVKP